MFVKVLIRFRNIYKRQKFPSITMRTNRRFGVLETINHPLGFFVLALLIIEAFLSIVLIFSDLDNIQKYWGMWGGLALFVILIIFVFALVWHKPKNLIFGEKAHLLNRKQYGTKTSPTTREELDKTKKVEDKK